jgi:hypothetical protein
VVSIVLFGAVASSPVRAEPEPDPAQILADTASGLTALASHDEDCADDERTIEIVLSDAAAAVAGLEVRRDGLLVPPNAFGAPIPVDPGKHVISATAPHRAPWSVQLGLAGGSASVSIAIPVLDWLPAFEPHEDAGVLVDPFAVSDVPPAERLLLLATGSGLPFDDAKSSASLGSTQRAVGWLLGGVGVTGIAAGTALGLGADSRFASQARASTALLSLGLTALVAGVVIYITAPPEAQPRDKPVDVAVVPAVGSSSLGLAAVGSF